MPGRGGRNRNRDPFYYWNNVTSKKPEAEALATRLGLDIPVNTVHGYKSGLMYPIRRLIITAEDTPKNYALLLGPLWNENAKDIIEKTRIEVLLCPPPSSPNHTVSMYLDEGSPRWTPRAPTSEEEAELKIVREMQEILTGQMEEKREVENKDIREMCMEMGSDWASNLGTLMQAVNAKNQGVGRSVGE